MNQRHEGHSTSLRGQPGDLPVRQHHRPSFLCGDATIKADDFLIRAAKKQKESDLGNDPAGEFLITGNRQALSQTAAELREWLYSRIRMFLLLGFQSVRIECIALTRPLREAAIDYSIIREWIDEAERAWFDAAFHAAGPTILRMMITGRAPIVDSIKEI